MQTLTLRQKLVRKLAYHESRFRSGLHGRDLNWWPDDRRLAALRDIHARRRAFILGNGPSLRVEDLERLSGEITFASNKIYLAFERTAWRPTYFVLCDLLVAAQNAERIATLDLPKFITNYARPFLRGCPKTIWFNELATNYPLTALDDYTNAAASSVRFSKNVCGGMEGGGTVIFNQLQLAFHMGITEVVLIGVDFSFSTVGNNTTKTFFNESLVSHGEQNHFHPDYRKAGEIWSTPNMALQRLTFTAAQQQFTAAGRRIVNASRRTALEVFPRVDFDALF